MHRPDLIKTFGAGPRFCPGKYLAANEMAILLSALCKKFDFELAVDAAKVREKLSFTMYPEPLSIRVYSLGEQ